LIVEQIGRASVELKFKSRVATSPFNFWCLGCAMLPNHAYFYIFDMKLPSLVSELFLFIYRVQGKSLALFSSKVKNASFTHKSWKNNLFLVYNFVNQLNKQKMGGNYFENCSNTGSFAFLQWFVIC
jgi:hypothetical protein